MLNDDVRASNRLQQRGLIRVLTDIVKFMYRGDFFSPPGRAYDFLEPLIGGDTALVMQN